MTQGNQVDKAIIEQCVDEQERRRRMLEDFKRKREALKNKKYQRFTLNRPLACVLKELLFL
jgi:hypothetical protein